MKLQWQLRMFPLVDFVCFESVQLNEFLNHMIAQNTFFIMVERDALDSVFRYLQEQDFGNILIKPRNQEWDAYWTRDSIVLLNLVSEHPRNTEVKHGISIEQLLVDVVAEKTFRLLYSKHLSSSNVLSYFFCLSSSPGIS